MENQEENIINAEAWKKFMEEEEAKKLLAAQQQKIRQGELGAIVVDEATGFTVKEVVELFLEEYRKLSWYKTNEDTDEDESIDSDSITYCFNYADSFWLGFKSKNSNGEEDIEYTEIHYWASDYDDETIVEFTYVENGELTYRCENPKTNKAGIAALEDIRIDLKPHLKVKKRINYFNSDYFQSED